MRTGKVQFTRLGSIFDTEKVYACKLQVNISNRAGYPAISKGEGGSHVEKE